MPSETTRKRYQPSPDLAQFVDYYWIVRWNTTDNAIFTEESADVPGATMTITADTARITGLITTKRASEHTGNGVLLGVQFKPGGFYPFFKKPMDRLTNQTLPLSNVFSGTRIKKIASELDQPDQVLVTAIEKLLRSKRPAEDPNIDAINVILTRIQEDAQLTSVQSVCEAYEMSERTLQRTFQHYVGIGLKWIVAHYRSQNNS